MTGLARSVDEFYYHMALYELRMMNGADFFNGLSYNSLLYLNVIWMTEECTVSKIADTLGVTKPAVTLKINELARTEAIVKTRSEKDRRVYYIRLSPRMEALFANYDRVFDHIETALKNQYAEEQLSLFEEILRTISEIEWSKDSNEQ
ncbi:MarR family transcriptional regulator [Oscillibacter hominis]|uniref:MarR family transcriptional regulator n=1 Tax=Oscillibacter hominis TaxID=2763056 RepID=A0A7G9B7E2_9FIRM|nr:MarR family transcriptional regulator [Oscillibacter hominis]QNL45473.1 MarR family transcriptional regulator [Oscillibacter hominis]